MQSSNSLNIQLSKMETRISVEQYFMYEVVATFGAAAEWITGRNRNMNLWNKQLEKLKKAFHCFMLELEVSEFKDLRLPSERQTKSNKKTKQGKGNKARPSTSKRAKKGGMQLPLFFVKTTKQLLLYFVEFAENITNWCSNLIFGRTEDFENRTKGKR
jgi:hypothetical protein|tara:strand:- start:9008 stop:9481 length:474 start_codon:yes stop_codon:yes gene_type:complete